MPPASPAPAACEHNWRETRTEFGIEEDCHECGVRRYGTTHAEQLEAQLTALRSAHDAAVADARREALEEAAKQASWGIEYADSIIAKEQAAIARRIRALASAPAPTSAGIAGQSSVEAIYERLVDLGVTPEQAEAGMRALGGNAGQGERDGEAVTLALQNARSSLVAVETWTRTQDAPLGPGLLDDVRQTIAECNAVLPANHPDAFRSAAGEVGAIVISVAPRGKKS